MRIVKGWMLSAALVALAAFAAVACAGSAARRDPAQEARVVSDALR